MSLQDPNIVNPRKRKRVAVVLGNPAITGQQNFSGDATARQVFDALGG